MRMVLLFVFLFFAACSGLAAGQENAAVGNGGPPAEEKAAQPGGDSFSLERIEDWNFILSRLDSQITRAEQVLDGYQGSFRNIEGEYRKFYDSIALQADELRFLLSISTPQDVFETTLRCQQIDDLNLIFRKRYRVIRMYRDGSAQLTARTESIRSELDRMKRLPQYSRYSGRIEQVAAKYQAFRDRAGRITRQLDELLAPELDRMLETLVREAARVRTETIDNVFFSRQAAYWQLFPSQKQILAYWYYTAVDEKQFSGGDEWAGDLICFMLIFIPLLLLFVYGGPRWFYPWLLRQTRFPDMYRKSNLFFFSGLLMVLALALYFVQFRTELSYSAQVYQFSQTIGALAMLCIALAFRMERGMMRRTILLYLPFILQNFLASTLFALVMPYQPLMLIAVPLNLLTAVWALFMLRRGGYAAFDCVLGWLALGVAVLETLLITLGFLYIGFTMMLTGFVVLGLFQAAIAASRMILTRIAEHAESRMSNIILRHLAFPLVWFGVCGIVIGNISSTYHLRSWLNHWARMQINVYNFLSFSVTDLLTISIVLLVLLFLLAMAKYLIFQRFENSSDLGMVSSFVTLGSYIVWALFGVFVLLILEVKYSSLLVILGGFSVGFGFALKEVLENFISGIILLVGQQVRPGDEIEFDGLYAKVKAVSFRATVIETFDGSVITLPNTNVLSKDFRNWTRRGSRMRRDLHVGVAYGSDLKLVRQTLLDAAAALPSIYRQPPPEVYCSEFQESAIDFTLRVWVRTGAQVIVLSTLREKVAELFDERGISIPFNQLDLHVEGPVRLEHAGAEVKAL